MSAPMHTSGHSFTSWPAGHRQRRELAASVTQRRVLGRCTRGEQCLSSSCPCTRDLLSCVANPIPVRSPQVPVPSILLSHRMGHAACARSESSQASQARTQGASAFSQESTTPYTARDGPCIPRLRVILVRWQCISSRPPSLITCVYASAHRAMDSTCQA